MSAHTNPVSENEQLAHALYFAHIVGLLLYAAEVATLDTILTEMHGTAHEGDLDALLIPMIHASPRGHRGNVELYALIFHGAVV